jgi:hypothetical protein
LLEDYADAPLSSMLDVDTGKYPLPIDVHGQLERVNSLRCEPSAAPLSSSRFFVNDLSGVLYTLDKSTRKFTPYINFVAKRCPNRGCVTVSIETGSPRFKISTPP